MKLFDNGTVTAPDGSKRRGVVVELTPASILVRMGEGLAWFLVDPDFRGRHKMHGIPADIALWFEPVRP